MCLILVVSRVSGESRLTILVNKGNFPSVEEAAGGEESVNWWDADITDDDACTECFAARELKHFLTVCTGLSEDDIQFDSSHVLPSQGDVFILGSRRSNPLIAESDLPDSIQLANAESYYVRAYRGNSRTVTFVEGSTRTGTLYGVYAYLERLGFRFYGLGEKGTVIPEKIVRLPSDIRVVENPSFLTRGFHAWEDRGNEEFFLWMARNRMNYWTSMEKEVHFLKKLGIVLADGGHTIQVDFLNPKADYPYNHPIFSGDENKPDDPYVLGDEYTGDTNGDGRLSYFEAHPEWYGLYDGKRSDNIRDEFGDNFCTSNRDANRELATNLIQSLIDGKYRYVDILKFWMMDARYRWCECEHCKQQGNFTDRLLVVVDMMNREIKKARSEGRLQRTVRVHSLAYLETITPPTRPLPEDFDYDNVSMTFFPIERCYDHSFADPSCTEFNSRLLSNYLAWTTGTGRYYRGTMLIGEYYNVSYLKSMPLLFTRILATDIPWYYKTGTRHFHYMHAPTRLWGTWRLNHYLLSRLLWNVDTDADELLDEFFRLYYPTSNERTRSFYHNLEKAMAGFKTLRYWGWKKRLKSETDLLFPKKHFQYESYHPLTNDGTDLLEMKEYVQAARSDIDKSLRICTDKREKASLMEDERRFAYGEAMVFFHYHLFRTAMYHQKRDKINASKESLSLVKYAEELQGITDLVQVASSHANAENGFEATQAVDVYNFFKKQYGKE